MVAAEEAFDCTAFPGLDCCIEKAIAIELGDFKSRDSVTHGVEQLWFVCVNRFGVERVVERGSRSTFLSS